MYSAIIIVSMSLFKLKFVISLSVSCFKTFPVCDYRFVLFFIIVCKYLIYFSSQVTHHVFICYMLN